MSRLPPSRRNCLALIGGALGSAGLPPLAAATEPASLRALAAQTGITFGTAAGHEIYDDAAYSALAVQQSAILVPDRCLKFDWLRPDETTFSFEEGDRMLAFAKDHGLAMRGHTLIWNDWAPHWLKREPLNRLPYFLDQHVETVMGHYAGALQSWDVVNEPFTAWGNDPGSYRQGPWFSGMGADYIFRAFQRAAAADPKTKLVLNEAWTERSDVYGLAVRKSLLRLVDQIKDKGLRLDAVGLQSHLDSRTPYDDASFTDFLHALEARGVQIYLTELDINDAGYDGSFAVRDRLAAERVGTFLKHALSVKAVSLVLCWGLSDRYSWLREPSVIEALKSTRLARPLPYDDDLRAKPMREAIAQAFLGRGV